MNDILKILYDKFSREEKRKFKFLIINFHKEKIQKIGIKHYYTIAICKDESEYNLFRNLSDWKKYFDNITIFTKKNLINIISNMPKFDAIIMNPPYDKNLHLKILEQVIPYAKKVVNISPVRWLFDPLAEYKKQSAYKKYEESISKKLVSLDIIDAKTASEIFNAHFYNKLGIYVLDDNGGYDYKIKETLITDLVKRFMKHNCYRNPLPTNGIYHIVLPAIHGHAGKSDWAELTSKDYQRALLVKPNYTTHDRVIDIHFNTETELKNYYDSLFTKFHLFCVKSLRQTSSKAQFIDFLPFMQDYTQPWDNKRFCEYFNITGYISDTEAELDSEWETILNEMKE